MRRREIKEKQKDPKVYTQTYIRTLMHTHKHTGYTIVNIRTQKKPKKTAEVKGCHEQLTPTGHSMTQVLELRRTTTLSK